MGNGWWRASYVQEVSRPLPVMGAIFQGDSYVSSRHVVSQHHHSPTRCQSSSGKGKDESFLCYSIFQLKFTVQQILISTTTVLYFTPTNLHTQPWRYRRSTYCMSN